MANADEKVVIEIEAKVAKAVADLRLLSKEVDRLKRKSDRLAASQLASGTATAALSSATRKAQRSFDSFDKGVKLLGTGLTKFLSLALKGTVLQMALFAASLISIHALFVVGNALHKAYAFGMKLIAGAAAGAAVAIGTVAAAIREQQAAMFAYKGQGAAEFGSGLNQVRVAMRGMHSDSQLAGLGAENLNKAFAAMSKSMNSSQISASRGLLRSLMDFGAAGQDPAQAAEKVGIIIAALEDSKKSMSDVKAAAKDLGPEMEQALKKAGNVTKSELKKLILSGELAKIGGVAGQFEAVNNTLIGQVKIFFNLIRSEFADFGQDFLEPAKVAMQKIFRIIQRDLWRVSTSLQEFGTGKFMDSLVGAVDKVSIFFVKLIREWLPKTDGMFASVAAWWERTARYFRVAKENLRPFIDGAKVVEDALSPIFSSIKESFVDGMNEFNIQVQENSKELYEFGERVSLLIDSASNLAKTIRAAFFDALPFINDVLSGVKQIFDLVSGVLEKLTSTLGGASGLMAFGIMGRQMRGTQGGYIPGSSVNSMNVNANVVNVGGVGGPGTMPGGPGVPGTTPGGPGMPSGLSSGSTGLTNSTSLYPSTAKQTAKVNQALAKAGKTNPQLGGGYGGLYTQHLALTGNKTAYRQQSALSKIFSRKPGSPRSWGTDLFTREAVDIRDDPTRSRVTGLTRQGRLGSMMEGARLRREGALGSMLLGNEKKGIRGINNTMGAKMGVGLGMTMASQFAPEEMRGALALGGMVGQYNPLAGLAVGLGGAALNAQSGLAGAVTGAGAGAAIGSMVAGPAGIAVGAALGGITGAIMGFVNKANKQAKEARKSMEAVFDSIMPIELAKRYSEFSKNLDTANRGGNVANRQAVFAGTARATAGRFGSLQKSMQDYGINDELLDTARRRTEDSDVEGKKRQEEALRQVNAFVDNMYKNQENFAVDITESEYKKMMKDPISAVAQAEKELKKMPAFEAIAEQEDKRLKMLQKASGKTTSELEVLAHSLGVNLYDPLVKMEDLVKQLGLTVTRTAEQMKQANADIFITSTQSAFSKEIEKIKAPKVFDEIGRSIYDEIIGGGATAESLLGQFEQLTLQGLSIYGGDPLKAFYGMGELLGTKDAPGKAFGPGGGFEGIDPASLPPEVWRAITSSRSEQLKGFTGEAATEISRIATGQNLSLNQNVLQDLIKKLPPGQQEAFLRQVQSGNISFKNEEELRTRLGNYGIEAEDIDRLGISSLLTGQDAVAEKYETASKDFKEGVDNFKASMDMVFTQATAPQWWNTAPSWWDSGDTSSPRGSSIGDTTSSRLAQTMARHSSVDSVLSGSRKITSSYRNFALGSMNSDHVNGNAIDLVGQNLGRYATLTRQTGGFAEFHGRGASRHLHAVPGPGGIGDTMMPMSNRITSVQQNVPSSSSSNYVFNINGSSSSPEEIANVVMAKIKTAERSRIERS
jgi:FtsZ-binding cell division protein ZapB